MARLVTEKHDTNLKKLRPSERPYGLPYMASQMAGDSSGWGRVFVSHHRLAGQRRMDVSREFIDSVSAFAFAFCICRWSVFTHNN